jgi:hypothetical protein
VTNRRDMRAALRAGLARAGGHAGRAGKELVAGVGAFLDEVIRVRREPPDRPEPEGDGPTRVELD